MALGGQMGTFIGFARKNSELDRVPIATGRKSNLALVATPDASVPGVRHAKAALPSKLVVALTENVVRASVSGRMSGRSCAIYRGRHAAALAN
jgi:hypothetical protein